MTDSRAQTTGRLTLALVLVAMLTVIPVWADPPVPSNLSANYTGAPTAAAATFRTTVQEYLSCNIMASAIELSWNSSQSWWEGTTTVEVEANRAYEFRTGWRNWYLTGYAGTANSNLDGTHGTEATDELLASERLRTGRVNILIYSDPVNPGPSLNSYPGQPQDQLGVKFNGGLSVGVVQVTLFAW